MEVTVAGIVTPVTLLLSLKAPAAMDVTLKQVNIQLGDFHNMVICGEYTGIFYDDAHIRDGVRENGTVMEFVRFKEYGEEKSYYILQSEDSLKKLQEEFIRQGGNIGQVYEEGQRFIEDIDRAKNEKDMKKLEDMTGIEAVDMSVSTISQSVKDEVKSKAEDAIDKVPEAEEKGSGGITLEEIPLDKEKWKEIFSKTDDEAEIDEK